MVTGASLMQGLPLKASVGAAGLALTVMVSVAVDEQLLLETVRETLYVPVTAGAVKVTLGVEYVSEKPLGPVMFQRYDSGSSPGSCSP